MMGSRVGEGLFLFAYNVLNYPIDGGAMCRRFGQIVGVKSTLVYLQYLGTLY